MNMEALDNLVKIKQLSKEPPDQNEFDGMVAAAEIKLQDIKLQGLSQSSQFTLAYGAAHALSLAALRWHGYRSDSRYLVCQCLQHTLNVEPAKWRVLDKCHHCRNLAEYEGHLEIDGTLLNNLISVCGELLESVEAMGPVNQN